MNILCIVFDLANHRDVLEIVRLKAERGGLTSCYTFSSQCLLEKLRDWSLFTLKIEIEEFRTLSENVEPCRFSGSV